MNHLSWRWTCLLDLLYNLQVPQRNKRGHFQPGLSHAARGVISIASKSGIKQSKTATQTTQNLLRFLTTDIERGVRELVLAESISAIDSSHLSGRDSQPQRDFEVLT